MENNKTKFYRAVAYQPNKNSFETRYCIVSTETGEVLDDAQGYGYKTAQKAHAAYAYKMQSKRARKKRMAKNRHIKQWLDQHKDFAKTMDETAFEILKGSWGPNVEFNANLVKKLLKEFDLKPDFTAGELLKVWQKGGQTVNGKQ